MSDTSIRNAINVENKSGGKALAAFLTAGFPDKRVFLQAARTVLSAGADILEIGIPFSDPLADGPVIQQSSHIALQQELSMKEIFAYAEELKKSTDKKIVAMGYANPILRYGTAAFLRDASNAGFDGLIVPDVPYDEYEEFYGNRLNELDTILLVTPVTPDNRLLESDNRSRGFLYYVSVAGTTGTHAWTDDVLANLQRVRNLQLTNKLMVGFGVSSPDDVRRIKPFCDGVICGSALVKIFLRHQFSDALVKADEFIASMKAACG